MGSRNECRKFTPNIFTKSKCTHCFRQREEHSAAALECNRVSRKVSKCGYLFVAPDWDFSNPLYRTKRWQRRWFVLYDDGELTYAVDDHPETIPQACIDMTKVLEVSTAEDVTGHINSLAITAPERITFVKGTCPEEAKWWLNILVAFPKTKGRHKRNATFPGGQATTQPIQTNRNRHNSYHKDILQPPVVGGNLETIPVSWNNNNNNNEDDDDDDNDEADENNINANNEQTNNIIANGRVYTDQPMSSKSPPTRDKLYPEGKAQARIRSRNRTIITQETTDSGLLIEDVRRDEKLKDIANTITTLSQHVNNNNNNNNNRWSVPNMSDGIIDEKPTRDENGLKEFPKQIQIRPQSLAITTTTTTSSSAPSIVSAIIKKKSNLKMNNNNETNNNNINNINNNNNNNKNIIINNNNNNSSLNQQQKYERGDPDGGCNIDEMPVNYINKINSEIRLNLPSEDLLNSKKGWLMKQDSKNSNEWTKHWFTLRGAALFYYRDPVAEERGVLDGVLDVNSLKSISEVSIIRNYGFQLTTWDNRRIVLSTITASIRNNWINVLKSAAGLQQQHNNKTTTPTKIQQTVPQLTQTIKQPPLIISASTKTITTTAIPTTPTTLVNQNELIKDENIMKMDVVIIEKNNNNNNNNNKTATTKQLLINNSTDDLKSEIEKDFMKAQKNNQEIIVNNNNNLNKLKCNINSSTQQQQQPVTPINTPLTPKSIIFSSDEEYRTASEGGRRDSIDWGSSISPTSPSPISIISLARAKDRNRSRSNSSSRLHKRSRSSPPSSRRSTIDSVGSDDLIVIRPVEEEIDDDDDDDDDDVVDNKLEMILIDTEKEMISLRDEAQEREGRMTDLMTTLEKTEQELQERIRDAENARDKLAIQLSENKIHAQEYIECLTLELNDSRTVVRTLEDKLGRGIEENELLYKKLREVGSASPSNICSMNRLKMKRMDSLSDLTNLNDIDPYCLERDTLAEEYAELKSRFEKAVNEIKAMKKELKDTQNQYDTLEIDHASLRQDYERRKQEDESQLEMMAARIQDLTLKYSAAERQVRSLKSKLAKSEKRRSLSLKGRESLSLPKELEEKVIELETKIDAIETTTSTSPQITSAAKRERERESRCSSVTTTPEERSLKRASARLRRKSLDSSSTESMQILLRLNTLEKRVECANNNNNNNSSNSKNSSNNNSNNNNNIQREDNYSNNNNNSSPKLSEHLIERLRCLEGVVVASKDRIEQSLQQLQSLKSSRTRRSVSPITITDKKDSLRFVERCLLEASKILRDSCDNCIINECSNNALTTIGGGGGSSNIILLPETNPIKLSLQQLEIQLNTKLNDLLKQRRMLRDRNELTKQKDLELLAERVAYESVCFGKLRDSIKRAENPIEYNDKQIRAEMAETTQLITLLRAKLSGKCAIKPSCSLDILASVLARRLILTAERTGQFKLPELTPVNTNIMDELLRQQNELNLVTMRFKNNAMETLASGLAAETLNYISANDAVQGAAQDAWRQAQETVNAELVQSEIAQIMMRNAQRFENSLTPSYGYTLTHQERISFEHFSDAVQEELRREMNIAVNQLKCCYEECIKKMKSGQWRLHLEQERKASEGRQLLAEFSDIVAHKSLIDARINILKGDYHPKELPSSKENFYSITSLQKYENLFTELAADLEITNPDDILAEADFNFMYKYFTNEFTINKAEIKEISNSLVKLEQSVIMLQSTLNPNTNITSKTFDIENLHGIHNKNTELKSRVDTLIQTAQQLQSQPCDECTKINKKLKIVSDQHQSDILELKKVHENKMEVVTNELDKQKEYVKCLEIEKLDTINEIENERKCNEKHLNELMLLNEKLCDYEKMLNCKEIETNDLIECLDEEREKTKLFVQSIDELSNKCEKYTDEYYVVKKERDNCVEQVEKERERIRKLEKHLEFLETEQLQQMENFQASYRQTLLDDDEESVQKIADEETLRERYQAEIEHLRMLCEKGLAAMESSHRRIISELEEKHRAEIQELLSDKEQALAEETQATLAALDAMRKAHQNEVQREVTRFKQEFVKQFQLGEKTLTESKGKEQDLEEIRLEILSLSEKYSFKCVEAASLEEKLKLTSQQVKQSQQIINQLEKRNKQLRAHLMSDDLECNSMNSFSSSKESTPSPTNVHDDDSNNINNNNNNTNSSTYIDSVKENTNSIIQIKKEIQQQQQHPRMKFGEEIKMSSNVYTPVYNPSSLLTKFDKQTNKFTPPMLPTLISSSSAISTSVVKTTLPSAPSSVITTKQQQQQLQTKNNLNNLKLRTFHNRDLNNCCLVVNDIIKNKTNLLCSPPPLNVKDVEHVRKFELEI